MREELTTKSNCTNAPSKERWHVQLASLFIVVSIRFWMTNPLPSTQSTKDQPLAFRCPHPQDPKNSTSSCGSALPMEALKSPATSGVAPSLMHADMSTFNKSYTCSTVSSHSQEVGKYTEKIWNFTLNIVACNAQTLSEKAWKWTWDISKASFRPMPIPTPQWVEPPEKNNLCPDVVVHDSESSPRHVSQMHNISNSHVSISTRKSSNREGSRMLYKFLVITCSSMNSWQWFSCLWCTSSVGLGTGVQPSARPAFL